MLKNKTRLLTVVCAALQLTNAYCVNPNNNNNINFGFPSSQGSQDNSVEPIVNVFGNDNNMPNNNNNVFGDNNNILGNNHNMFGNILNGFTNPFPNNNNNPRNVIVDLSDTNNRDNRPLFLAKKSKRFVAKRTKENTKYVRLNYKEFMKINKKIKSSIGSYIEQENIAYNNDQAYGRIGDANRHLKAKEYYEKLISDKFPILNDLNVTHVNYPDFKINNIVQTVKDLKNIIKDIIDYEDKNCECKSKDYTILKEILQRMQNDEMTKEMFNSLKNIGVIAYHDPDRTIFFENNEQKTYIFQLDNDRKYFENICDSNDNRVLENNIKTIYYTITNFKKIKTLLKNQPGAVKVIKKRFIEVIRKILSKMNTSGLNKKFIQFKINRSNITFNLMEQRIINGEEPIFEYTKTKKENELVFYDYYNDMLNKTALFYPTFETEQQNVEEILEFLREYIETNRPKTYSCVGYQKPSKLWNKVSIAINLKEFLSNNVDSALYNWWKGISSKRKVDSIMRKAWKTYKKNTDLKEWLTAFENKINNENEPEKCKTIKNFIDQLEYHKDKLPKKKITKDITEILSNILTSNSFNNFITNEYVKNIFNERYNKFSHIRRRKGGFTPYDIYNSYPDEIKIAYNKVMKTSKAFLSIVHSKNNNYSNELKNILLNYSNSIEKLANDEHKKYDYFYKFITNEAIVPAGFWDNKILYK